MALEQMEGFELAGRTVCLVACLAHCRSFIMAWFSFESILSMKKEHQELLLKILWMRVAVCRSQ